MADRKYNTKGRTCATAADAYTEVPEKMPMLVTVHDAARVLNVEDEFVRKLCRKGTLKSVKIGDTWRINRDAVLAYLE